MINQSNKIENNWDQQGYNDPHKMIMSSIPPIRPEGGWLANNIIELSFNASFWNYEMAVECCQENDFSFVNTLVTLHHIAMMILEVIPVIGWIATMIESEIRTSYIASDRKIVEEFKQNRGTLDHNYQMISKHASLSPAFWDDEQSVLDYITNVDLKEGMKKASFRLRSRAAFLEAACKVSLCVFAYASASQKNNKELVVKLLNDKDIDHAGLIIKEVSSKLKTDKELVKMALNRTPDVLDTAEHGIPHDVLIEILEETPELMKEVSSDHFADDLLISKWMKKDRFLINKYPHIIKTFTERSQDTMTEEQAISVIENDPKLFQFLPERFRANFNVACSVVNKDGMMLQYVADELKKSDAIMKVLSKAAYQQNPNSIAFIPSKYKTNLI